MKPGKFTSNLSSKFCQVQSEERPVGRLMATKSRPGHAAEDSKCGEEI